MSFFIIEQDGDGGGYITEVENPEDYQSVGDGVMIALKDEDYFRMCESGSKKRR